MPFAATNALNLQTVVDISGNRIAIRNLLLEGVKVHFVDYHHTCDNIKKFNFLCVSHPSIRIITINPELRDALALLITDFNNSIRNNEDIQDDDDNGHESGESHSDVSIEATEPGNGTCPQCGFSGPDIF